jgi:hypothetical protein
VPIPPDLLVTPAQLSRFNVPSAFLAQFEPRPIDVIVSTPGLLGAMAIEWRWSGDASFSAPIFSDSGSSWAVTIEDAFVDLTFAGTSYYYANKSYTVDRNGVVTGGAELTAARFDRRLNACSSVTTEAMTLMRDAIRPPLVTWGDDARTHAAAWVYAVLKRGTGAAPVDVAVGDEHVFKGEDLAIKFFTKIGEDGRPDSMTDTSPTVDGPLLPAYPYGDTLRGY